MRIAVPAEQRTLRAGVCPSLGRAPLFAIYDTEREQAVFVDNAAADSQGGAGVVAAQMIVDQQVEAVITPRCGRNAAEVMQAAGIPLYRAMNASIEANIAAYREQRLQLLEEIHAGFHRHGRR